MNAHIAQREVRRGCTATSTSTMTATTTTTSALTRTKNGTRNTTTTSAAFQSTELVIQELPITREEFASMRLPSYEEFFKSRVNPRSRIGPSAVAAPQLENEPISWERSSLDMDRVFVVEEQLAAQINETGNKKKNSLFAKMQKKWRKLKNRLAQQQWFAVKRGQKPESTSLVTARQTASNRTIAATDGTLIDLDAIAHQDDAQLREGQSDIRVRRSSRITLSPQVAEALTIAGYTALTVVAFMGIPFIFLLFLI